MYWVLLICLKCEPVLTCLDSMLTCHVSLLTYLGNLLPCLECPMHCLLSLFVCQMRLSMILETFTISMEHYICLGGLLKCLLSMLLCPTDFTMFRKSLNWTALIRYSLPCLRSILLCATCDMFWQSVHSFRPVLSFILLAIAESSGFAHI
jgi:hypothetical protein